VPKAVAAVEPFAAAKRRFAGEIRAFLPLETNFRDITII